MQHLKQQGAQHGIPEQVLEQSVTEGNSLELIVSSWHQATMAAELYILKKEQQDLSHSPLAKRMAEHLVKIFPNNQPAEQPVAQNEVTHVHDPAAEAGSS